jgi:hypothetical protein
VTYKADSKDYFGQAYLAQDIEFKEGTNIVEKFNTLLPQVCQSEGVEIGYELFRIDKKTSGGKAETLWFTNTDNVRSELLLCELQSAEVTCLFKAAWYPHVKDISRSYRNNKYLPPILPSSKKTLRGQYGGQSPLRTGVNMS